MLLEALKIVNCSELKYIIRDDEDRNPRSHDSMFSKLKLLSVHRCEALEFILPIYFCEDLPLLEIVELSKCKSLRYMFDQYPKQGGLHQMQNENTLHSLKVMSIEDVPSFVNIYPECCYLKHSCNVCWWNPLSCFLPKSETTNKDEPSISEKAHLDHIVSQGKYVGNLRVMNIGDISNLKSLFSISIASSMSLLEGLVVSNCDELEHIITEEVDGHHHMNANSIFPNLRTIEIRQCHKLEYVFPASCSRNFVRLKSLLINGASQLKYVFGKSCDDDNSPHQNQNIEINLSALNELSLEGVPNMVSMCPENYDVKALSLQDIFLGECGQLPINDFLDLSIVGKTRQEQLSRKRPIGMHLCKLKNLTLGSMEMETMYDLERLQIASPVDSSLEILMLNDLNRLRNICVGPKHHLIFQNLSQLIIYGCHQMKFILSAPISRNLPYLRTLWVGECKELESIIEDDDEECCFPNLCIILVEDCESLKCLFSISTRGSLPQLWVIFIERAPELEQVFERKQGTTQELDIKNVFPKLLVIHLIDLPKLHTICSAIDFQTVMSREVKSCPNISLTLADNEFLESKHPNG
ncbi:hypothetical protein K1719_023199 [Acacia pycnantha]|nr:hypothetical protein K1719_023199 [Acacia pycnantha]